MTGKRGRPAIVDPDGTKGGIKTFGVTVSGNTYANLKRIASERNITLAQLVRIAVDEFIQGK
jgi:predicted DNA-binding ribbon-helix-helix protein